MKDTLRPDGVLPEEDLTKLPVVYDARYVYLYTLDANNLNADTDAVCPVVSQRS
jgi:hypothetical protein